MNLIFGSAETSFTRGAIYPIYGCLNLRCYNYKECVYNQHMRFGWRSAGFILENNVFDVQGNLKIEINESDILSKQKIINDFNGTETSIISPRNFHDPTIMNTLYHSIGVLKINQDNVIRSTFGCYMNQVTLMICDSHESNSVVLFNKYIFRHFGYSLCLVDLIKEKNKIEYCNSSVKHSKYVNVTSSNEYIYFTDGSNVNIYEFRTNYPIRSEIIPNTGFCKKVINSSEDCKYLYVSTPNKLLIKPVGYHCDWTLISHKVLNKPTSIVECDNILYVLGKRVGCYDWFITKINLMNYKTRRCRTIESNRCRNVGLCTRYFENSTSFNILEMDERLHFIIQNLKLLETFIFMFSKN